MTASMGMTVEKPKKDSMLMTMMGDDAMKRASTTKEEKGDMMMGTEMGMEVSEKREMMMDTPKEKEMMMMEEKEKEMDGSMMESMNKRDGMMEEGPMLEEQMGKSLMDAMKRDIKRMFMMKDTLMDEGNTSKASDAMGTQNGEMMG